MKLKKKTGSSLHQRLRASWAIRSTPWRGGESTGMDRRTSSSERLAHHTYAIAGASSRPSSACLPADRRAILGRGGRAPSLCRIFCADSLNPKRSSRHSSRMRAPADEPTRIWSSAFAPAELRRDERFSSLVYRPSLARTGYGDERSFRRQQPPAPPKTGNILLTIC